MPNPTPSKDQEELNPFAEILGAIADSADKDMKENSVAYRDLSANKDSDLQTLFDVYDLACNDVVHSMTDVVKEKYGIKRMDDELYYFLRSFSHEFHMLTKHIEETEGRVCCVDKSYSRMMKKFQELVKANQLKETKQ